MLVLLQHEQPLPVGRVPAGHALLRRLPGHERLPCRHRLLAIFELRRRLWRCQQLRLDQLRRNRLQGPVPGPELVHGHHRLPRDELLHDLVSSTRLVHRSHRERGSDIHCVLPRAGYVYAEHLLRRDDVQCELS